MTNYLIHLPTGQRVGTSGEDGDVDAIGSRLRLFSKLLGFLIHCSQVLPVLMAKITKYKH